MHMIYQTRYSFFHPSPGWRSEASKEKKALFDSKRLARREYFFEKVTLRSLADQTDQDFVLNVLASEDMPKKYKTRLTDLCKDSLGERAHVIFGAAEAPPRVHFRNYRWEYHAKDPWSCQIVLDDDDALAMDFNEKLKVEAFGVKNMRARGEKFGCISFANGLTALFRDGKLELHRLTKPAINLGLAIVAPSKTKYNLFDISHNNVPRDRPTRVIYSQSPYYIRSLHDDNDSRGRYQDDAVSAEELDGMIQYFPLLKDLIAEWNGAEPAPIKPAAAPRTKTATRKKPAKTLTAE
ncbi:glycosyltransferase [Sulfitobacter sp. HNIBRBA3233]|uniref:glycosyltransferase n=1 Tax=Sulfitobacter marinivivus TaxID=3158558 RepID=UPI0032DF6FF6